MASSGNFSTWNPLRYSSISGITYSDGNCKVQTTTGYPTCMNNFAPKTGKWYIEFYNHYNAGYNVLGIVQQSSITKYGSWLPDEVYQKQYLWYSHNGNKSRRNADGSGTSSSYGSSWGSGNQIIGCALDMDNGKVWWSLNGTFQASGDPANGSNSAFDDLDTSDGFFMAFSDYNGGANGTMGINCGQDSTFGGAITAGGNADANGFGDFKYAPPTGFLALCTANLPISADIDPAQTDDDFPQKNFNTVLFDGNGSSNAVTGLGFKPDLIWGFTRSGSQSKRVVDSTRGGSERLYSDLDSASSTGIATISSFDSDGFTATGGAFNNDSGKTCGAWCWRANGGTTTSFSAGGNQLAGTYQANTKSKFSIITYTGSGSTGEVLHGMSATPNFIIWKDRGATYWWGVYHKSSGVVNSGYDSLLYINSANSIASGQNVNVVPDSTKISMAGNEQINKSGNTYVMYAWADVEGYQRFGTYIGNNTDNNGPFCYLGFRPRLLAIKGATEAYPWFVFDSARNPHNLVDKHLRWDSAEVEATEPTGARKVDFLSNGFKVMADEASINGLGDTYVYMAWADQPAKFSNAF